MEEPGKELGSVQQEARTCPVCGTKFAATADKEFCPVCILHRAFGAESGATGATNKALYWVAALGIALGLAIFVRVDFLYVSGTKASEEAGFNAKLVAQAANQADQDAYIASLGGYPTLTSYPQEFSAEVTTISNGNPTTHIWVYRQADKERTDSPSQDPQTTIVLRSDKKAWNIWSKSDSHSLYYTDSVFPPYSIVELAVDPSFPPDNDHVYTKVGVETVNGQVCDKYTFTTKVAGPTVRGQVG